VNIGIDIPILLDKSRAFVVDIETDEAHGFVGAAFCQGEDSLFYSTKKESLDLCVGARLIVHGGKFDIREMKSWGLNVSYDNIHDDTQILAYVQDSTQKSYGLKKTAERLLNMKWATYEEMTGKGKKKRTLDKLPVEDVARYCGCDALATWKLRKLLYDQMADKQTRFYDKIELPTYKLLSEMEDLGVHIDPVYLRELDKTIGERVRGAESRLKEWGDFNPRSPKQVLAVFQDQGIKLKSTDEKTLKALGNRLANTLLEYREFKKLHSTYITPYMDMGSGGVIHARFTQSTETGRLASSQPNLQNVPNTEEGRKIRKLFVPPEGHRLLLLDYSQIETRLFAHFSKDPILLEVFKDNRDIHSEMAKRAGLDPVKERAIGKTLVHGITYGSSPKMVSDTAGMSMGRATNIFKAFWKELRTGGNWIAAQKVRAHQYRGVETLLGRWRSFCSLRELKCLHRFTWRCKKCRQKAHVEREVISTIIQGSASDIMKKAMLDCKEAGYMPRLTVHDELHFYVHEDDDLDAVFFAIKKLMEQTVSLSVPLVVEGKYVDSWMEGK